MGQYNWAIVESFSSFWPFLLILMNYLRDSYFFYETWKRQSKLKFTLRAAQGFNSWIGSLERLIWWSVSTWDDRLSRIPCSTSCRTSGWINESYTNSFQHSEVFRIVFSTRADLTEITLRMAKLSGPLSGQHCILIKTVQFIFLYGSKLMHWRRLA